MGDVGGEDARVNGAVGAMLACRINSVKRNGRGYLHCWRWDRRGHIDSASRGNGDVGAAERGCGGTEAYKRTEDVVFMAAIAIAGGCAKGGRQEQAKGYNARE